MYSNISHRKLTHIKLFILKKQYNFLRFNSASLKTCTIFNKKGIFALPWYMDYRIICANQKYLEKSGMKVSQIETFDGFLNFLHRLKKLKINNFYPIAFSGRNDWNVLHNFSPWIWSEGGSFISYDKKWKSNLLNIQTLRGIYKYIFLALESYHHPQSLRENSNILNQRFARGESGVISSTTEILNNIRIPVSQGGLLGSQISQDGLVVINFPKGKAGSFGFLGGSNLCIPKKHSNNILAHKLVVYLTSNTTLNNYLNQMGFLPSDKNLWKIWKRKPYLTKVLNNIHNSKIFVNIALWGKIELALVECLSEIWTIIDSGYFSMKSLISILIKYDKMINSLFKNFSIQKHNHMILIKMLEDYHKTLKSMIKTNTKKHFLIDNLFIIIMVFCGFGLLIFIRRKRQKNEKTV